MRKHGNGLPAVCGDGLGPPGPPVSGEKFLELIRAGVGERLLIEEAVQAVLEFERELMGDGRMRMKSRKQSAIAQDQSAEAIIARGAFMCSIERQAVLLHAVVVIAKERGACFYYTVHAPWQKARRAQRSA